MSQEQLVERLPTLDSALDRLEKIYHVPFLLALAGFMLWIRVHNWRRFLVDGEVLFSGNDAWYHLRQVRYTVENWPSTLPFESWTSFPMGTAIGQFGTLYDQIVATAALVIGLGSPSEQTTALTLLFAPAVFGTLVAIPAYFLAKRFGGRFGGVVGVTILALSPSTLLGRSVVGFSDHHAAEAFFQVLAVAVIVIALTVAEREKPVYEQFVERDVASLRRPVGWAVLAGIAISVYIWVWPPGLLLVGIFGVFLLIALPAAYLRGESPEHVAIVSAVTLSVVGVLTLVTFQTTEISVTSFSLLHPALAFLGAIGCVFMAWLARTVEARDLPGLVYPGTILGLFVVGAVVMAVATPSLFDYFLNQLERIVGLGSSATSLTVAEAQPPFETGPDVVFREQLNQVFSFFRNSYGLAFFTAIAGAVVLLVRLVLGRSKQQAAAVFVLVWTALIVAATLTQTRFNYYLIVPICVLNAVLVGELIRLLGSANTATNLRNLEAHQVLTVLAVVLLITAPLVVGSGAALTSAGGYADERSYPGSTVRGWSGSLDWMANNTPAEGTYGGYNNSMDYYGEYERTDDFDYPDGAYGVLSWWDYGHWITTLGERIPTANPFQQNARQAANFLLADNVSRANEIARTEDGEGVRYVMIDWKMADPAGGPLFTAPFTWYNDGPLSVYDDVTPIVTQQSGQLSTAFLAYEQRHYETMRTRLYSFHGSAVEPEPVVVDYESPIPQGDSIAQASVPSGNESAIKRFDNMSAARAFVEEDGSAQIGGVGAYPQERVAALEHYRLADASQRLSSQLTQTLFQRLQATGLNASELVPTSPSWVKTFERVPGATVEGTGPANTTVEATVEMRMPGSESTFNYTQQATTDDQGAFTMTLPYSTTDYDQWGTEQGATNVSVQATGPYTFQTPVEGGGDNATRWNATAEVSEGAVIGRTNQPMSVELQQEQVSISNSNATNASSGNMPGMNVSEPTADSSSDGESENSSRAR